MATSPISTPSQAQLITDMSNAQFNSIRTFFGINDYPFQPEKTYIIFDAISGNNTLHIDIGASSSYSILKGDGTVAELFTDTGGNKILNYAVAGRYLITIDGDFNGIDTIGASAGDKNKYISITGGTNYPLSIVNYAFDTCLSLELINFKHATSIGNYTFHNCNLLFNANFINVITIGDYAFSGCSLLSNIFVNNPTTIGGRAFENCFLLNNINLKNITSIGNYAFLNCASLTSVFMYNVTTIGTYVFSGCVSLLNVFLLYATSIGSYAFSDCTSLANAFLLDATSIGIYAFYRCTSLANIYIANVLTIGQHAFDNCSLLDNINLKSVTSIGSYAFLNTTLFKITIKYSSGLTINSNAFLNIKTSDLYVSNALNISQAQAVETKALAAGMTMLTNYRLLY